jgi:hypothetical protein
MRIPVLAGLALLASASAIAGARQDHASQDRRGTMVMGFDQNLTSHHFLLFADGGAIDVSANDPSDAKNRDAIRSHLPHIAIMFGSGNFEAPMLVHDSGSVPGTKVMAERKDRLHYQYVETPNGGRVNIVTTDPQALDAVHAFLKYQIDEHKTGDSKAVRTR